MLAVETAVNPGIATSSVDFFKVCFTTRQMKSHLIRICPRIEGKNKMKENEGESLNYIKEVLRGTPRHPPSNIPSPDGVTLVGLTFIGAALSSEFKVDTFTKREISD